MIDNTNWDESSISLILSDNETIVVQHGNDKMSSGSFVNKVRSYLS